MEYLAKCNDDCFEKHLKFIRYITYIGLTSMVVAPFIIIGVN